MKNDTTPLVIWALGRVKKGIEKFVSCVPGNITYCTDYRQSRNIFPIVPHVRRLDTALLDVKQDAKIIFKIMTMIIMMIITINFNSTVFM